MYAMAASLPFGTDAFFGAVFFGAALRAGI
jgi:hypothetical protein